MVFPTGVFGFLFPGFPIHTGAAVGVYAEFCPFSWGCSSG